MNEGRPLEPAADETLDAICGGAVRILQRADGYRFTLDSVLLAHFAAEAPPRGPTLDLGSGSGILLLILARRFGWTALTGLELQPQLHALAERNVRLNGLEDRVTLMCGDLVGARSWFARGAFTQIICNPPYGAATSGRISPNLERAIARNGLRCSFADVAAAIAWLLCERSGTASLVYPAARLSELFATLRTHGLAPRRLRLVHTRVDRPAKLALVGATRAEGGELSVLPPLVVHPGDQPGYTEEVRRMLEG